MKKIGAILAFIACAVVACAASSRRTPEPPKLLPCGGRVENGHYEIHGRPCWHVAKPKPSPKVKK